MVKFIVFIVLASCSILLGQNNPPEITSTPPTKVILGQAFIYDLNFTDPDVGDTHSFSLSVFPTGMTIDDTGLITWTPDISQQGIFNVHVLVRDSSNAVDSQTCQVSVSNLIMHLPFNGNAVDCTGNGFDGTVNGATLTEDRFGNPNSAYSFNNNAISISKEMGEYYGDPTAPRTYSTWVKPTSSGVSGGRIFTNGPINTSFLNYLFNAVCGYGSTYTLRSKAIDCNVWHNLVLVINDIDSSRLFVDGVIDTAVRIAPQTYSYSTITIGSASGSFKGSIDDFKVFSSALSVSEIESLCGHVNHYPTIASTPDTVATQRSLYTYQIIGNDVDPDDTLSYFLEAPPAGMSVINSTVNWIPNAYQVDTTFTIVVKVKDQHGKIKKQSFHIYVNDVPDPLMVTSSPPLSIMPNSFYQYNITVQDSDYIPRAPWLPHPGCEILVGPPGLYKEIYDSAGLILRRVKWSVTSDHTGIHNVTILLSYGTDATDSVTQSWQITVGDINDPPVVATANLDSATENIAFTDTIIANDADGNPIFFYLLSGPPGMTIDLSSGIISYLPTRSVTIPLMVRASDGVLSDTANYNLYIRGVNDQPVISCSLLTYFDIDTVYSILLTATDEENSPLTWSLLKKPSTMSLISNTIVWGPTSNDIGPDTIILVVSDGELFDTLIKPIYVEGPVGSLQKRIPENLTLSVNPNPANPTVNIQLAVPAQFKNSFRVELFDIKGKRINNWQLSGPGYHSIIWNGTDARGGHMSSGLFIVRAIGGGKVLQKKILLMK